MSEITENVEHELVSTSSAGGNGADTAGGLAETAQEYGQRIASAASRASDFVSDRVQLVGEKIKELQNKDLGQVVDDAKDFARRKPGQAILISAAAGLVLGLLLRSGRKEERASGSSPTAREGVPQRRRNQVRFYLACVYGKGPKQVLVRFCPSPLKEP